jgi:hypothetical protein
MVARFLSGDGGGARLQTTAVAASDDDSARDGDGGGSAWDGDGSGGFGRRRHGRRRCGRRRWATTVRGIVARWTVMAVRFCLSFLCALCPSIFVIWIEIEKARGGAHVI